MKEEDIRKREVLNKYLELVKLDAERIFKDKSTFCEIPCPACGSNNYELQFEKIEFCYVQCCECDTIFVNPRPTHKNLMEIYVDSQSTKFWTNEFFLPMAEARREKIFKPRVNYIIDKFPELKKSAIGDIGAGFGIFAEELKKIWSDASIIVFEPSNDMAEICRKKGLSVIESPIEDVDPLIYQFDLLTAFELFEHLQDPHFFAKKVFQLIKPSGYLYITTLNGLGFDIQVLWDRSKSLSPPHHLNFFNPYSIKILLEKIGFKIIEISTPGELDWDIVEGGYRNEAIDPGRFFRNVSKYGDGVAKMELQNWIRKNNFSSHMRVIAQKV